MSEYQYYEFAAVERPLAESEMDQLRNISSRARITPAGFVNEYQWGDLKANPVDLMHRFFDAHVYLANWGSAVLMLKLPRDGIEHDVLEAFSGHECLEVEALPEHWLLIWSLGESEDDLRFDFVEGEGWMAQLLPLREELLRGDYRSLYIGWLRAVTVEEVSNNAREPMALHGLGELTAAQKALAEFLEVDGDLLVAVGADSPSIESSIADDETVDGWLDELPRSEVRGYLRQLLSGQGASAERALKRRYSAWKADSRPGTVATGRSVETLWQRARQEEKRRLQEEAEARSRAEEERRKEREARLAMMANDFRREWQVADDEANRGHGKAYDRACQQLIDLHDAYVMFSTEGHFQQALESFLDTHRRRGRLIDRLVEAGLTPAQR